VAICWIATAQAAETLRWTEEYSEETGAAEVWTDYFGSGYTQACGFDFKVDYKDRFAVHVFENREIWNILIRDIWTNLETGFSFEDFAAYTIVFDYQTGLAKHHGAFWRIRVPGTGKVLLDVGGFMQDWYDDDWPILPESFVGNNHDVNGPISAGNPPPISYCDLLAENFEEAQ
jgi:hypothetical protein